MTTQRSGVTIVELLIVMMLGLSLLGAAYTTLIRQEQAYADMGAMTGAREDARTGLELLTAELREVSAAGGDILWASPDSIRFRAMRNFGLLCSSDKNNKKLVVARVGVDPFRANDSIAIYADGDSLVVEDDSWQREQVSAVSNIALCTTTLGVSLGTLLPGANLVQLTIAGSGLKWDSIYPGAPLRSYQVLSYKAATVGGDPMLVRVRNDTIAPLVGPLMASGGIHLRYFNGAGTELTSFPLSAADRALVRRVRMLIRTEREGASSRGAYQDSLITDVYTRGS